MSICIQIPTNYGPMLVARHDINQTQALWQTGWACDQGDIHIMAQLARWQEQALGRKPIFADIGANLGTYSLALATLCDEIHAFEPQRILFNMICGSVALQGWRHIHVYNQGLSDTAETVKLPIVDYENSGQFGGISLAGPSEHRPEPLGDEEIFVGPLDDHNIKPDLIKIDVEGMEARVLAGALGIIAECRPIMMVEDLKMDYNPADPLDERIRALGYEVHRAGMNLLCIPSEIKDKIKIEIKEKK